MEELTRQLTDELPKDYYYSDVKNRFQPLDLIAFSGSDIVSEAIKIIQEFKLGNGTFSHVGIVVDSEILPDIQELIPGRLYVWESTMTYPLPIDGLDNVTPDVFGNPRFGVQIRDLEEVVSTYTSDGTSRVAVCPLIDNPWFKKESDIPLQYQLRRQKIINVVRVVCQRVIDKTYDFNCFSLLGAMFPFFRTYRKYIDIVSIAGRTILKFVGLVDDEYEGVEGWLFCSELVAEIYQEVGIIGKDKNPKDVVPIDFFGVDQDGIPHLVEKPIYILPDPEENETVGQFNIE